MDIPDWRSPASTLLSRLHNSLQEKQVRASLSWEISPELE